MQRPRWRPPTRGAARLKGGSCGDPRSEAVDSASTSHAGHRVLRSRMVRAREADAPPRASCWHGATMAAVQWLASPARSPEPSASGSGTTGRSRTGANLDEGVLPGSLLARAPMEEDSTLWRAHRRRTRSGSPSRRRGPDSSAQAFNRRATLCAKHRSDESSLSSGRHRPVARACSDMSETVERTWRPSSPSRASFVLSSPRVQARPRCRGVCCG